MSSPKTILFLWQAPNFIWGQFNFPNFQFSHRPNLRVDHYNLPFKEIPDALENLQNEDDIEEDLELDLEEHLGNSAEDENEPEPSIVLQENTEEDNESLISEVTDEEPIEDLTEELTNEEDDLEENFYDFDEEHSALTKEEMVIETQNEDNLFASIKDMDEATDAERIIDNETADYISEEIQSDQKLGFFGRFTRTLSFFSSGN